VQLETAFGKCDMQEANKSLHSLNYIFGYLHPSHHLHFEERVYHTIKNRGSKREERVIVVIPNRSKLSFEGAAENEGIALDGLGDVGSSFGDRYRYLVCGSGHGVLFPVQAWESRRGASEGTTVGCCR